MRHPAPARAEASSRRPTRAATTRSSSSRRAARRTSTSGRSTARRRSAHNQPPQCEKLDEIVENAARAFQAGHLVASAIRARMVLLNPQYPDGQERAREGRDVQDRRQLPGHRRLRPGGRLVRAVREGEPAPQERRQGALATPSSSASGSARRTRPSPTSKQYQKDYGNSNPTETAQIAFAIGAHYADKEDWENARKALAGAMGALDKAPPDIQVQAHATLRARAHAPQGRRRRKGEYARVRVHLGRRQRRAGEDRRRLQERRARTQRAHNARQGARRRRRGDVLRRRGAEEGQGRFDPVPRLQGPGHEGRHQEVHGQDADALGAEEAGGHRGGRQGLPEDHRAPAGAAAALGHRRRVARRADVGQLRRRLPQGALPQGVGQEGLRARHGRHALLERGQGDVPRAPRRGVRADQEARRRSPRSSAASTTR